MKQTEILKFNSYLLAFISLLPFSLFSQIDFWEPSNKGIENVSISNLVISDDGTILAHRNCLDLNRKAKTQIPVLFRSKDGGVTWENITQNIPGYKYTGIHRRLYGIHKIGNTFFIKLDLRYPVPRQYAILRSDDFGNTWSDVSKNLINSSHTFLTVGEDNNLYSLESIDNSIWKSEDLGKSWKNIFTGANKYRIASIFISNNGHIIAQLREGIVQSKTKVIKIVGNNIIASNIDKTEFSKEVNPLIDQLRITRTGIKRGVNSNDLYACFMLNYGSFTELFQSKDNGESWQCISKNGIFDLFHVSKNNRIYASSFGAPQFKNDEHLSIRSGDEGKGWQPLLGHPGGISAFAAHPDGTFFIGTSKGVYKSKEVSEPQLTYGTTIITHGYQPFFADAPIFETGDWAYDMAAAIFEKINGKGCIRRYSKESGRFEIVNGNSSNNGENILLFDWAEESNYGKEGYSEAAGDALFASLILGLKQGDFTLNNVHFIGHSRGTVVNTEAIERLITLKNKYIEYQTQINIDHVTNLDAHDWGAISSTLVLDHDNHPNLNISCPDKHRPNNGTISWKGPSFNDSYYQEGNPSIPIEFFNPVTRINFSKSVVLDGRKVDGTYNVNWSTIAPGHSAIHKKYLQTISNPQSAMNGYKYSRLLGKDRPSILPDESCNDVKYTTEFDFFIPMIIVKETSNKRIRGILNGSFDRGFETNIPGWVEHGGIIKSGVYLKNDCLIMEDFIGANPIVQHNRFYIPKDAIAIKFTLKSVSPNSGSLKIFMANELLSTQIVDGISQNFEDVIINIPEIHKDSVVILKFEFNSINSGSAKIIIDDVQFTN